MCGINWRIRMIYGIDPFGDLNKLNEGKRPEQAVQDFKNQFAKRNNIAVDSINIQKLSSTQYKLDMPGSEYNGWTLLLTYDGDIEEDKYTYLPVTSFNVSEIKELFEQDSLFYKKKSETKSKRKSFSSDKYTLNHTDKQVQIDFGGNNEK